MSDFICFKCKKTYAKRRDDDWNEYKAAEEFLNLYPEAKNDLTEIMCTNCNNEFKKWFDTLTDLQKKEMRKKIDE